MAISLDSYFAFNNAAMTVKSQRLEVISANIVNASTPGYKAKDLDFHLKFDTGSGPTGKCSIGAISYLKYFLNFFYGFLYGL